MLYYDKGGERMKNYSILCKESGEIRLFDHEQNQVLMTQGDWYRSTFEIKNTLNDEVVATIRRNKFSLSNRHIVFDQKLNYLAQLKFTKFFSTKELIINSPIGLLHTTGHLTHCLFNVVNSFDEVLVTIQKGDIDSNQKEISIHDEENEEILLILSMIAMRIGLMMSTPLSY